MGTKAPVPLAVDIGFWAILFLGTALLLFSMVYALVLYSDLSRDHVNPIELCELINRVLPFEYAGHAFVVGVLLLRKYFFGALLQLPLVAYHGQLFWLKQYQLDNTTIFGDLPKERRKAEVKLVFYLLSFFLYLYFFVQYLIS